MKQFDRLRAFCLENNLEYSDQMEEQFETFCSLLIEKNKVMNLTAVTDPEEIEIRHYIDSLESAGIIKELQTEAIKKGPGEMAEAREGSDFPQDKTGNPEISPTEMPENGFSVVDLGTGAGFPGIPLAIALPNIHFTLADSLNKRILFLEEAIARLSLKNAVAVQIRAEELGQSSQRESFDICVSRAVADLSVLLEYCLPLVKTGGNAIFYKSGDYKEELNRASHAMEILGGETAKVREFLLPHSDIQRSLIVVRKKTATPVKYPRRSGKPSKSPIK